MAWKLVNEILVPAEQGRAWEVEAGQLMRIIAIEGPQCGDLAVYNAHYYKEAYSADFSYLWNCYQDTGNVRHLKYMYSRPPFFNLMMEITEDKVAENAVNMAGHCNQRSYELMGGTRLLSQQGTRRSCQDNIAQAIAPYGLTAEDVPQTLNFWMTVEYTPDGKFKVLANKAEKGDRIDFVAHMDCLVALSSCPANQGGVTSINSGSNKPLKAEIYEESA